MAEHEYYEVNGRQIRVRPTESGQEIDEYGNFHSRIISPKDSEKERIR